MKNTSKEKVEKDSYFQFRIAPKDKTTFQKLCGMRQKSMAEVIKRFIASEIENNAELLAN